MHLDGIHSGYLGHYYYYGYMVSSWNSFNFPRKEMMSVFVVTNRPLDATMQNTLFLLNLHWKSICESEWENAAAKQPESIQNGINNIILFLRRSIYCASVFVSVSASAFVWRWTSTRRTWTKQKNGYFLATNTEEKYANVINIHTYSFQLPPNGYTLRSENCWIETRKSQKSHIDNRIELTWMRSIPGNGKFMAKISFYLCQSLTTPKIPPLRF